MMDLRKIFAAALCALLAAVFAGCAWLSPPAEPALPKASAVVVTESMTAAAQPSDTAELSEAVTATSSPEDPEKIYSEQEIAEKITELVKKQETAMKTADSALMAETINPVDTWLITEASHLTADQKLWPVSQYTRTVTDIKNEGYYYSGTVAQNFVFQGIKKGSEEKRYFNFDSGAVWDMGTALEKASTGIAFVSFPEGSYDFAIGLGDTANSYIEAVNLMWGMDFSDPVSIKIYGDKNTFLYSVKLSMPDWAGGWYERGESIKTYLYESTKERYEYLVRHEATHMMLTAATNDNASYWMQEGFATTLPGYVTAGKLAINRVDTVKEAYNTGRLPTFADHVSTNLETLEDMFDVRLYYGFSSAMVMYLLEKTDDATLLKLFNELKTYPYISLTMGEKVYDTEVITEKCIKKATGMTFEKFYEGFDAWLKARLS